MAGGGSPSRSPGDTGLDGAHVWVSPTDSLGCGPHGGAKRWQRRGKGAFQRRTGRQALGPSVHSRDVGPWAPLPRSPASLPRPFQDERPAPESVLTVAGREAGQQPGPASGNDLFLQAVESAQKALGGGTWDTTGPPTPGPRPRKRETPELGERQGWGANSKPGHLGDFINQGHPHKLNGKKEEGKKERLDQRPPSRTGRRPRAPA